MHEIKIGRFLKRKFSPEHGFEKHIRETTGVCLAEVDRKQCPTRFRFEKRKTILAVAIGNFEVVAWRKMADNNIFRLKNESFEEKRSRFRDFWIRFNYLKIAKVPFFGDTLYFLRIFSFKTEIFKLKILEKTIFCEKL